MINKERKKSSIFCINCSLFTKIFLVKEAQLLNQGINQHINSAINQNFGHRAIKTKELGLIGYFINPILKNHQSDLHFTPSKTLSKKMDDYHFVDRKSLLEKALYQHVILRICDKNNTDHYMGIATETLEELAHWKKDSVNE